MPELQMSGDIGFEELSPQLQALILSGAGNSGGVSGNVSLKTEVLSVTATEERQKEFTIPKKDYIQGTHNFELRIGSVWIHPDRYQILGNKIVFNEEEVGIAQGRRLDFVFCYLVKDDGTEVPLDGANIKDGSITKTKLGTELQGKIDSIETIKQSTEALSTKLDSSVKEVEASNNFNSIRIIKNDGTTTDVPIKILGGGSGSSLNVFKTSEKGGSYTASAETNSFVINELEESMDVSLIFKNLFLVKDVDFTIDKESKTVVLTFNLKENETIYYTLTGTSFSYNDLDGAPNVGDTNGLSTTSKEVVGAINENRDSISILNNDRGYRNCKVITSFDAQIESGKYSLTNPTDAPDGSTNSVWTLEVTMRDGSAVYQQATCLYSNLGNSHKVYFRCRTSNVWSTWQEITTSQMLNDRGYLNIKDMGTLPFSSYIESGFYTGNPSDAPTSGVWVTEVVKRSSTWVHQRARCMYDGVGKGYTGVTLVRDSLDGGWSEWQQVATTQMVDTKADAYSHFLTDFNDIPNTARFIRTGTNTSNAPSLYQFVGVNARWDSNFDFTIGVDLSGKFYIRKSKEDWKEVSTTTKSQLSLLNGWVDFFGTTEPATISRSGNIVTIKACIKSGTYTNGTTIFNIPSGYRPSTTQTILVDVEDGSWVASRKFISIYNDGRCVCNGIHSNVRVTIYISYSI